MKYKIVALVLVVVCFSCSKTNKVDLDKSGAVNDSLIVEHRITNGIGVLLSDEARLELEDWKEYQKVASLMTELYNTTKSDVLENAGTYADEIKFLRDSIRIKELDNPKIVSRLNVLLNQSLRLKDMKEIPSITNKEVKGEVFKLCESFSALNRRVNTFYKTKQNKKDLEGLIF